MAPFDIREVRELMEGDELELEKIGDRNMVPATQSSGGTFELHI